MQRIIEQLEKEFNLQESSIIEQCSPVVKYLLLLSFWTVLGANSLFDCIMLLMIMLVLAIYGRTIRNVSLFLVITIVVIVVVELSLTLYIKNSLSALNVIFALQVTILFSSPVILLGNSRLMQHYYFWSKLLGGNVGVAVIGFGRTILSLRGMISDTANAYRGKGISPLRNPVTFLISLEGSVLHFASTFADAIEMRNLVDIRGEGMLADGITSIDVLLCIVICLIPLVVFMS